MVQIASGVRDIQRGLGVLRAHPALWKWVIAPAAITLVLLLAAIAGVGYLVDPVVDRLVGDLPGWFPYAARSVVTVAVILGLAFGALVVFVSVVGMVAGPFNELLSEHIEAALTGEPPAAFSWLAFARGAVLGIVHGLRRIAVSLFGLVLVLLLGLVPVIGTIAAALIGGWLAGRAAAYDCYDAVLSRRSLSYRDKLAYLARNRGRTFGLGAAVAAMLLVPGVNLVALGLGTAGATVAAHAMERDARPGERTRRTGGSARAR